MKEKKNNTKKKKDSGFVVKDKRLFAESDEPRPQEELKAPADRRKAQTSRTTGDSNQSGGRLSTGKFY